jgi:hypothetical protein
MRVALAEAAAWIERAGAKSYARFLLLERAELARLTGDEPSREHALREAHRLFVEIARSHSSARVHKERRAPQPGPRHISLDPVSELLTDGEALGFAGLVPPIGDEADFSFTALSTVIQPSW